MSDEAPRAIAFKACNGATCGRGADAVGNFLSTGYNLVGASAASGFGIAGRVGDQVGTGAAPIDPLLAPLADNGGPTLTHALQPGSPALDAGEATLGAVATDQRGLPRFTKSPGAPTFLGFDNSDNGTVMTQGVGLPNALHTVQAAPSITASFTALLSLFSDASGNLVFQDADAATFAERFYRFTYS